MRASQFEFGGRGKRRGEKYVGSVMTHGTHYLRRRGLPATSHASCDPDTKREIDKCISKRTEYRCTFGCLSLGRERVIIF